MPDDGLMQKLESERRNGRDDYPIRAVWNSILAGIIFEHGSIESLRRELSRNAQLRVLCGLTGMGKNTVLPSYVYSRFFKKLFKNEKEINKMFGELVKELYKLLPDFGKDLSIDSKAINSLSRRENKKKERDDRRDIDANWGSKE